MDTPHNYLKRIIKSVKYNKVFDSILFTDYKGDVLFEDDIRNEHFFVHFNILVKLNNYSDNGMSSNEMGNIVKVVFKEVLNWDITYDVHSPEEIYGCKSDDHFKRQLNKKTKNVCDYCGSNKITIFSYESIFTSETEEKAIKNHYFLDNELNLEMKCWDCGVKYWTSSTINHK